MPKRGLSLDVKDYNDIVRHRYLAKKRKDLQARILLRAILLVHEGNTLEQVAYSFPSVSYKYMGKRHFDRKTLITSSLS